MAERVITELIDDLDGSPAAEKIDFAVGGSAYRIDLSEENAKKFWDALRPYIDAATPAARAASAGRTRKAEGKATRTRQSSYDPEAAKAAREYFQEHPDQLPDGQKLPERGRTPAPIIEAWRGLGEPGL